VELKRLWTDRRNFYKDWFTAVNAPHHAVRNLHALRHAHAAWGVSCMMAEVNKI
jgi:hypothetical protein